MGRSERRLPYANFSREFKPDQSLPNLLADLRAGETALKGRWISTVNGIAFGDLAEGWHERVRQAAPETLTATELAWVEHVARGYIIKRAAFVYGIPWGDPKKRSPNKSTAGIRNRIAKFERAAKALWDATEIYNPTDVEIWRRLEGLEPKAFRRDDIYPAITTLINRVVALRKEIENEFQRGDLLSQKGPLFSLIDGIASLFVTRDWPVSASKISNAKAEFAKVSPFIVFLAALMRELPEKLREHVPTVRNEWALSNAVSEAMEKLKKHGWKPDLGVLREFTQSISPKT